MIDKFLFILALAAAGATDGKPAAETPAPDAPITVKHADYGPFLGEYRPIVKGVRDYCGPEASLCEVYCPNKGFLDFTSKRCRVVYACGPKVVKSAEAESGEILVLDCRQEKGTNR